MICTAYAWNSRLLQIFLLLTVMLLPVAPLRAQTRASSDWTVRIDPSLPNALILGDSISIGYTRAVRALLAGKANLLRPMRAGGKAPVNCGSTLMGVTDLHTWLADTKYDVIHFNWGLHDIHHRDAKTRLPQLGDKVNLPVAIPLADYQANLERLVSELEKTGARLIWASTTIVPEGDPGRIAGEEKPYNEAALKIMVRHGIPVDDLYALTSGFAPELFIGPGNVHYQPEGYRRIAAQVARSIAQALPSR